MQPHQLVKIAQQYGRHKGLKLSTVSTYANNDGKYFAALAAGAGCTVRTAIRLLQWFSDHWPSDLEWPSDVPRPTPKQEAA